MTDPRYGGQGISALPVVGRSPLETRWIYYSMYEFMNLTRSKEALVDKVTQNIYRPCCNNSNYFPDCNHGMAMLGSMELAVELGSE